jgi:tRNA-Thr(GGU) m(6)t(6)A37 methyltransferase TsaA
MEEREIGLRKIGLIRTPWKEAAGTPIQPSRADEARGVVEVGAEYGAGLRDLEGFERIWLVYWLHRSSGERLVVVPFLDTEERGVFATRSPARPNGLGLSAVRLLGVRGCELDVAGVDMLDETPLLDIKPYVPEFDSYPESRAGWLERARAERKRADGRFAEGAGEGPGEC